MYHKTLSEVLRQISEDIKAEKERKVAVMVASHNEDTVRFAVKMYAFLSQLLDCLK